MSKWRTRSSFTLWTRSMLLVGAVASASIVAGMAPANASGGSGSGSGSGGGGGGTSTGADLRITGTLSTSQPAPGATFTETEVVVNRGPETAVGAWWSESNTQDNITNAPILSVTADGNAANCSISAPDAFGTQSAGCSIGDIVSGGQATVFVTRTAPTFDTTVTFWGSSFSQTPDPQTLNNDTKLTIQVSGNAPPPSVDGPCATVEPSSASQTLEFTTNTMSTKITNCGGSTLTNLVVRWDAGATAPSDAHVAFDCSAPSTGSFTLAAGASLTVSCKTNGFESGPTPTESGTGTVTVYDQCTAPNTTLVAGGVRCTDEPQTLLAQADFSWFLAIPSNPAPRGGGRGGTG